MARAAGRLRFVIRAETAKTRNYAENAEGTENNGRRMSPEK
jgi:hypothetical protein